MKLYIFKLKKTCFEWFKHNKRLLKYCEFVSKGCSCKFTILKEIQNNLNFSKLWGSHGDSSKFQGYIFDTMYSPWVDTPFLFPHNGLVLILSFTMKTTS
jgi:hypothetical protein